MLAYCVTNRNFVSCNAVFRDSLHQVDLLRFQKHLLAMIANVYVHTVLS